MARSKLDEFHQVLTKYIRLAEAYQRANQEWERLAAEKEEIKRAIARSVTPEEYLALADKLGEIESQQAQIAKPVHEYEEAGRALKAWFGRVDRATIVVQELGVQVEFNHGLLSLNNLETKQPQPKEEEVSDGS